MKNVISIVIIIMIMVLTAASAVANEDPIWGDVNESWKKENYTIYKKFIETEYYSDGFQMDNYACMAAYNMYLNAPEEMTTEEIEESIKVNMKKEYDLDSCVSIEVIGHNEYYGREVLKIIIDVNKDLRTIENTNINNELYEDPIYGIYLICYDRY